MFRRKKDKGIDFSSLNEILAIGSKLAEIIYVISIIAIVLLGTYLIKEWGILKFVKEFLIVISPIFIGFIIAWLFHPLVRWFQTKKIPRILACILVYLMILCGLFLLLYLIVPTFIDQIKDFLSTIPELLKSFKDVIDKLFQTFGNKANMNISQIKTEIYNSVEKFSISLTTNIPSTIINIGKNIVSGGITFILGLMIGFYMLFDFDKLNEHITNILPKKWRENYQELGARLNNSLRNYIQGLLLVMLLVFITQSIGLTLAGLKAPLIFALFCALTDVIPYIGPYIGAIPAVIVGFTISPLTGVFCLITIIIVQILENNFYQPLIMGHTMKLHPVTIMLGLLIFQHFFGIIGMVVATPVIAAGKVVFTYINEKMNIVEKITGNSTNQHIK